MRSSIKEVWALQFPCHEVLNICSNSSPVSKLTHLHPFFSYSFLPIQWICPTFSLVSERRLWSLSPFASFHEENGENLYCPIMGHFQIWPRKADFYQSLGKKRRFLLLFKVRKKTDTQAFDRDCCLTHQKRLLLSDCTWNPMMIFRNLPIFWGPVDHYPHSYNWVPAGTNPTPRNPKYLSHW